MEIDINNIGVAQKLRNSKNVSEELKLETIEYIEQLQKLVNDLSLQPVISSDGKPYKYMTVRKALRNIEMVERGFLSDIQTKKEIVKDNIDYIKSAYSI